MCRSGDLSRIGPNSPGDCLGSTNALHRVWLQWIFWGMGPTHQWECDMRGPKGVWQPSLPEATPHTGPNKRKYAPKNGADLQPRNGTRDHESLPACVRELLAWSEGWSRTICARASLHGRMAAQVEWDAVALHTDLHNLSFTPPF